MDGNHKDSDYGPWDPGVGGIPTFQGKHKDHAKAYHSENETGPNASYPHPSITASDCSTSVYITGHAYDMNENGYLDAYSHIPW